MILSELAKDCGSPEKKSVRGLNSTMSGRRTETLSEHPCLGDLGGDKTLSECHNVDLGCVPTHRYHGKKSGRLLSTLFIQSIFFHAIYSCA